MAIDFGDAARARREGAQRPLQALRAGNPAAWKALRAQGIFRGTRRRRKVAFLYTGQGSQYANMLAACARGEPIVAAMFDEADAS